MARISTRNLRGLPDVDRFRRLLQSLAVLDAIMSPEWQSRYYSFNRRWARNQQMGSMRNGSGDEFFALFNRAGCFLKGFAHESLMSPFQKDPPEPWPGIFVGVPKSFSSALSEPAFAMEATTFCIWRCHGDKSWSHGAIEFPDETDADGSAQLLAILDGAPAKYRRFAEEYYEATVPLAAVRHIYDHLPLTADIIKSLNPTLMKKDVIQDIRQIGYPSKKAT